MVTAFGAELMMLAAVAVSGTFILIVMRPQFGAYLYLITSPLIVGMTRGAILSSVRPNEILLIFILGALAVRIVFSMLARVPLKLSVSRVDWAIVLLAFTSSVVPLLWRIFRDLPVSADDLLYSTVLWKYLLLYWAFRVSIRTDSQVAHCLWFSMASAALVAVVGILQVEGLLGIPEFLHSYYDEPFEGSTAVVTDRATSTVAASFGLADLMIMNLMIAMALLRVKQRGRWILVAASAVFLSGCIAAGEFSGIIGLGVAAVAFAIISRRLSHVLSIGVPALIIALAAFLPVVSTRLAGFGEQSGEPDSWQGRWNNLQDYFFPELFSSFNWVLGVRPAPRLPANETWRQMVYIESGYVWLLWVGGIPLLVAFIYFAWVSGQHLWQVVRERSDAVGVAGTAGFAFLIVLVTLMLFDPHLTLRGAADLFFPLLSLSFVQARSPRNAPRKRRIARPSYFPAQNGNMIWRSYTQRSVMYDRRRETWRRR